MKPPRLHWAVPFLLLLVPAILAAWLNTEALIPFLFSPTPNADAFDAMNVLFSGMAFAGVIAALLLQQSQINQQDQHFEAEVKRLEKEAKAAQEHQQEQISFVVLTCYLEAVGHTLSVASDSEPTSAQRESLARIEKVLGVLHPQAQAIASTLAAIPGRGFFLAERLRELVEPLRLVVYPPGESGVEENLEIIVGNVTPAMNKLSKVLDSEPDIDSEVRAKLNELKTAFARCDQERVNGINRRGKRGTKGDDEFDRYLTDARCIVTLADQIRDQLMKLDSSGAESQARQQQGSA